ncbi:MAG: alpha/beta hydrolase [Alphaproteobacteria bacterium HGW-Alphaproteobacteria-10]|nr:MAG: alpha/beta hydrolase [Alphaproteobacteria bacterium HGW-Alphaproteobacteria-10]
MQQIILVPGFGGLMADRWRRWWQRYDPDAQIVEPPDWRVASLASWLPSVVRAVEANPGAYLVAHSLGAAVALHLAARRPDLAIGGALLVAPADVDGALAGKSDFATFAPLPAARTPWPTLISASGDDPWIAPSRARLLARRIGAQFVRTDRAAYAEPLERWWTPDQADALLHTLSREAADIRRFPTPFMDGGDIHARTAS